MTHPATPPDPTVAWYLDAVRAHQEHDEAVQHASALLAANGQEAAGQRLLDSWAAIGSDREEDVLALPPEPEVGTTVRMRAGALADHTDGDPVYGWVLRDGSGIPMTWCVVLRLAGPQGVRIVRDGGDHG